MPKPFVIRQGWMRFMYLYTILGAGGVGLGIVIVPELMKAVFRWPGDEPIALGIAGSVYVAFGLLSMLGLRDPAKSYISSAAEIEAFKQKARLAKDEDFVRNSEASTVANGSLDLDLTVGVNRVLFVEIDWSS